MSLRPSPARCCAAGTLSPPGGEGLNQLDHVEAARLVDDIEQAARVLRDVVGLRRVMAFAGLGNEIAAFLRMRRVGDVDDAQAAAEPGDVEQAIRVDAL